MILKGVKAVKRFKEDKKQENLTLWYERNPWAKSERERDYTDEDYPGPGLEGMFWDVPNM